MAVTRTFFSGATLLAVTCATLVGCSGSGHSSPGAAAGTAGQATHSPTALPTASPTASPMVTPTPSPTGHGTAVPAAARGLAPCGNGDLLTSWGYGGMGQPLQASAVDFKNVGGHTCTLRGYPGVAIADSGTVIDATRVLNGFRGDQPPLTRPPLVTLRPGGTAHAVVEWRLNEGHGCYPAGTGVFEVTAPDTTNTVLLSRPLMGRQGICSSLEINPVTPGAFGLPATG
ncbi:DUF4232 domain-containing protein [Streptacidiphilus neutrinimicus]|uniref:DUF4232 domain-containing protein n=1 Tax=Streptacidiphilus neutrinimicus TaxID=105420 RepID=UPI0005A933EF|nr:DUF4232 domain-containing protein [Streptacidiphilus neutrinimicus]